MKKRVGLFVIAMVLVGFALALQSAPVEAKCLAPACFASPGCCLASECADWCRLHGGGGTPFCSGGGEGGCCYCSPPES